MPISPKEAQEALSKKWELEFNIACEGLDEGLRAGIRSFYINRIPSQIIDQVRSAYEDAGWKIAYLSDKTGGDYFTFSE